MKIYSELETPLGILTIVEEKEAITQRIFGKVERKEITEEQEVLEKDKVEEGIFEEAPYNLK